MSRQSALSRARAEYFEVVNRTDKCIRFYDGNGDIAICEPNCHVDLLRNELSVTTMVIIECDSVIADSAPDDNAVYARFEGRGRDGKPLYLLYRKRDNVRVNFFPHDPFIRSDGTYIA